MKKQSVKPTGREKTFRDDEIIVSKTDTTGRITYANRTFLKVAGYTEEEIIGEQHNIIRHPAMPRCVFKFLWDTIESGEEIFAYVINQCKNGDHYWVFAHVTPSFGDNGEIIGFHSSRRTADRNAIKQIEQIYALLRAEEERHDDPRRGLDSALGTLVKYLGDNKVEYDQFVFSL